MTRGLITCLAPLAEPALEHGCFAGVWQGHVVYMQAAVAVATVHSAESRLLAVHYCKHLQGLWQTSDSLGHNYSTAVFSLVDKVPVVLTIRILPSWGTTASFIKESDVKCTSTIIQETPVYSRPGAPSHCASGPSI